MTAKAYRVRVFRGSAHRAVFGIMCLLVLSLSLLFNISFYSEHGSHHEINLRADTRIEHSNTRGVAQMQFDESIDHGYLPFERQAYIKQNGLLAAFMNDVPYQKLTPVPILRPPIAT